MKRIVTYISSALLLITGLCISCQKEQNFLEEKGPSVNEVIVKATIGGADTKVSFTEDGSTLKTAWENDDHIVGWDKDGNAIELEIASIDNGTAIFKTVEGSSAIPTGGKVYMIYAPGKSKSNISNKSLEYSLADQGSGKLPALMTATGEVSNNVLTLTFTNQLAILAVKNPTFPVTAATNITGLKLSGSNIRTKATFSMDGETLKMDSSENGEITRACDFTTAADGKTDTTVYFAVLPNSTAADVTVSTTSPTGYQISSTDKSFEAGQCYLLDEKEIKKQTFTVTVAEGITGGTISTNPTSGSLVAWGTEVTVTATPATGYELATLTYNDGTDRDVKATGTFTMPQKDVTVSGTFQLKNYDISADGTESSGTYTVEGGTYTITKDNANVTMAQIDDVIKVTPTPNTGYSGGTVTVKKTDTDEEVTFDDTNNTFEMPAADVTITVSFTHDEYDITGTVTPDGTSGSVTFKKSGSEVTKAYYGDEITVVDAPATGYELESITAKDADNADVPVAGGKFTMPEKDVTVTVTFKKKVFSFSVDNSTKVVFAPGNLYAKNKGTAESPDWEWDFYGEQYQFHPKSMEVSSKNGEYRYNLGNDTEIDMFCWGYNETNSTDPLDQSKNSTFIDWGKISGLPDAPYSGGWRTLSSDEWTYLLNTRTSSIVGSTTNARYVKCSVSDGTKDYLGLMIFPDTFTWPTKAGDAPKYINNGTVRWDYVSNYNNAQFKELKKAGVVFLPAAGYRDSANDYMRNVGSQVYYGSCSSGKKSASSFHLDVALASFSISCYSNDKAYGQSVRLVSTVQ